MQQVKKTRTTASGPRSLLYHWTGTTVAGFIPPAGLPVLMSLGGAANSVAAAAAVATGIRLFNVAFVKFKGLPRDGSLLALIPGLYIIQAPSATAASHVLQLTLPNHGEHGNATSKHVPSTPPRPLAPPPPQPPALVWRSARAASRRRQPPPGARPHRAPNPAGLVVHL